MSINQSLSHGLEILLLFDGLTRLLTVAEISKRLEFNQSKAYRLVRTLVKHRLLQEKPGTAKYGLGLNAFRIGQFAWASFDLVEVCRPLMKELSVLTRETVLLTAVNGTEGIVLERVESEEPIRYSLFQPGVSIPLHAGASSKILMAYAPKEELERIIERGRLKRYTRHTITNPERLRTCLREIRKKGFAFSDQEVDRDVRAIAAPILNQKGELVVGLSIAGPSYRMDTKGKIDLLIKLVTEYAQKLSNKLFC